MFVGFQHGEILVSADQAILADGTSLPAKVGNSGTFLAGFPMTNLKTAVETAGDPTQTTVQVKLVGTEFGIGPPRVPLPASLYLANDGYSCPNYTMEGRFDFPMVVRFCFLLLDGLFVLMLNRPSNYIVMIQISTTCYEINGITLCINLSYV